MLGVKNKNRCMNSEIPQPSPYIPYEEDVNSFPINEVYLWSIIWLINANMNKYQKRIVLELF